MQQTQSQSPSTLVAVIVAARKAGDRELEREYRRLLQERFNINISFARDPSRKEEESEDRI